METTTITLCDGGITTIMKVSHNQSRCTTKFHHREFPLQATLHCYGVLDKENDRTARIFGRSKKELKQKAKQTARRLFGKSY